MELLPDNTSNLITIEAYEHGKLIINGKIYTESVAIRKAGVQTIEDCRQFGVLKGENLDIIIGDDKIDVLLIGTGPNPALPPAWLQQYAIEHQIGLEVMTTEPACRTFNILASDDRACLCLLFI